MIPQGHSSDLERSTWSLEQAGEAMLALAKRAGFATRAAAIPPLPEAVRVEQETRIGLWIESLANWFGLESEWIDSGYASVDDLIRGLAPALVRITQGERTSFLALAAYRSGRVFLLGPDLEVRAVPARELRAVLCAEREAPHAANIEAMLDLAGLPSRRRGRARHAIFGRLLSRVKVGDGWLLRLPPGAPFLAQLRAAGLGRKAATLALAHTAQYVLNIASWAMLGRGALQGRIDAGLLIAWALLFVTQIPFRILESRMQALFAIDAGGLLKRRLLHGALRLAPDEIRAEGAGGLLGRVIESEAVESLALGTGIGGLVAIIELAVCAFVLSKGAAAATELVLLALWSIVSVFTVRTYLKRTDAWTVTRLAMTNDLVERIVGHRTRLAQLAPEKWHQGESEAVAEYIARSERMDASAARIAALLPRGWLVVAMMGLLPTLLFGSASSSLSAGSMAITLGGILLASGALGHLAGGLTSLGGALLAWKQVKPLFHAAGRTEPSAPPDLAFFASSEMPGSALLEARDVTFRYRDRGEPVLRGCTLRIDARDRILLEGGSGGGKSTFGAVLAGLRSPETGLLLLNGLDRSTLGAEAWRKRVVAAPQFHENHVLSGMLAFNLLMGRAWPPSQADLDEAEAVCRELDLGGLLDRMPGGLMQMVGETGWQLSHGEKSRVYIARALLQNADLIVLDESFGALDPETMRKAMQCVDRRARAFLVIAHP
ncbi:ATP-binding cassette domain-containing protein [Pendulispora brunnea]|uniref:ATP-binding cassette domain-containing protein n=1 Tax=Pendulispora brunnea TaxID=2905690 RepID=A0ABZ2KEJ3_9BACT